MLPAMRLFLKISSLLFWHSQLLFWTEEQTIRNAIFSPLAITLIYGGRTRKTH